MARWPDRRPFEDYGFHFSREWWLDLAFGFLLGAFTLTAVFLIEKAAGWLKVAATARTVFTGYFPLIALTAVLNSAAIAVGEELTFRGYQVRNLAQGL